MLGGVAEVEIADLAGVGPYADGVGPDDNDGSLGPVVDVEVAVVASSDDAVAMCHLPLPDDGPVFRQDAVRFDYRGSLVLVEDRGEASGQGCCDRPVTPGATV
jgi:hypothetical protein